MGQLKTSCKWCNQKIDPEICWCGDYIVGHSYSDHIVVPLGCKCYYMSIENFSDFINLIDLN